jgi:hypothetical protein
VAVPLLKPRVYGGAGKGGAAVCGRGAAVVEAEVGDTWRST